MGKGNSHVKCDSQWCPCLGPQCSQQYPSPCCPAVSHIRNPVASLGNYASQVELWATTTEGSLLGGGLFRKQCRKEGTTHPQAPSSISQGLHTRPPAPPACLPAAQRLQPRNFLWLLFPSQLLDKREILSMTLIVSTEEYYTEISGGYLEGSQARRANQTEDAPPHTSPSTTERTLKTPWMYDNHLF